MNDTDSFSCIPHSITMYTKKYSPKSNVMWEKQSCHPLNKGPPPQDENNIKWISLFG